MNVQIIYSGTALQWSVENAENHDRALLQRIIIHRGLTARSFTEGTLSVYEKSQGPASEIIHCKSGLMLLYFCIYNQLLVAALMQA